MIGVINMKGQDHLGGRSLFPQLPGKDAVGKVLLFFSWFKNFILGWLCQDHDYVTCLTKWSPQD